METNTKNLECRLSDFISELESKSDRLNASGFPFPDVAFVYAEVAKQLKNMMTA